MEQIATLLIFRGLSINIQCINEIKKLKHSLTES